MVFASRPSLTPVADMRAEDDRKSPIYDSVKKLFETGRGNQLRGVRGTLWAAYDAVTEYVSYERGEDRSRRVDGMWFGTGARITQRALDTALEMAA